MNDVEVQSICDYLEECLFEPSIVYQRVTFSLFKVGLFIERVIPFSTEEKFK